MIIRIRSVAIAAAVISGFAASENLLAASCATPVTYQASGTFGSNVIKGTDGFKLAGQPFSITLYACEGKAPSQKGPTYDVYAAIALTGTVKSSLITTPYSIRATPMTFILVDPPAGPDLIEVEGNLTVFGSLLFIHGSIALPAGTLANASIAPFSKVSIVTASSGFSYSNPSWRTSTAYSNGQQIVDSSGNAQKVQAAGTSGTSAPVWNETIGGTTNDGTVVWTAVGPYTATELAIIGTASATASQGSGANAEVRLLADAVDVTTARADGTQPVMLHFYATGVRDASEVHVRIAGQNVPVLHSGASADFPGLDEVTVEIPRSLAGMGQVDVVLTADGQEANPVPVHLQ